MVTWLLDLSAQMRELRGKAEEALEVVAAAGRPILKLDCETETETAVRFCINSYQKIRMFKNGGL
jgi:hypothetical protein